MKIHDVKIGETFRVPGIGDFVALGRSKGVLIAQSIHDGAVITFNPFEPVSIIRGVFDEEDAAG
jgi:hypothetical protein